MSKCVYNNVNAINNFSAFGMFIYILRCITILLICLVIINFSISSFVCLIKNPHQNNLQPLVHFGKTMTWNHNIESAPWQNSITDTIYIYCLTSLDVSVDSVDTSRALDIHSFQ